MRHPHDTRGQADAMLIFAEAMAQGGITGLIEKQEAEGQQSFVNSNTLPTKIHNREILDAAGVKFLGLVEGDDLFQYVELPEGWKKEPTEHSMWSKLLDAEGNERASIFYKAAFYDRSAHARAIEES